MFVHFPVAFSVGALGLDLLSRLGGAKTSNSQFTNRRRVAVLGGGGARLPL